MVKKISVKDKEHLLAKAIKENFAAGIRLKDIVSLYKINKQIVNYWIYNPIWKRKRREKLSRKEINTIIKWVRDKLIIQFRVSAKNIQSRFYKLS